MHQKTIYIKDIGEIDLLKSNRVRNLSITVRPFEGVKVTFPSFMSFDQAEEFVYKKEGWLRKNIEKIGQIEETYTIFDKNTDFSTRYHKLKIIPYKGDEFYIQLRDGFIKVFYPEMLRIRENLVQKAIRNGIELALREEAKAYLPDRVRELALKHNFRVNNVFIKNTKTRWGSCSSKNNINLNLHLMRLPDYLIDYVILHELCHTVERNHGRGFWSLLDKYTNDAKKTDKELNNYNIHIY